MIAVKEKPVPADFRGTRCPGGMTVTELLVAVGVLAIMIMGFSTILSLSQRLVVNAQDTMQANLQASAIEKAIRPDLHRVTRNGFLAIGSANGQPALVATVAGVCQSLTGESSALASVVTYAMCDNAATGAGGGKVLLRQAWVLSREVEGGKDPDQLDKDLADLEFYNTAAVGQTLGEVLGKVPSSVSVPAADLAQVGSLWQVLAQNCKDFTIEWASPGAAGTGLSWSQAGRTWTWRDSDWPVAIKIRFVLADPSLPKDLREMPYEVICPIAQ